jgi:cyanophycinase
MMRDTLAGSATEKATHCTIRRDWSEGLRMLCNCATPLRASRTPFAVLIALCIVFLPQVAVSASPYQYIRIGNKDDAKTTPVGGIAMMGGGKDLDDAFRWLCQRTNGGDFLILRAEGDDAYNPYVNGLCHSNSVATLVIPDRTAAADPTVADIIRHAEAIFIAGGNQARYVNFWKGTPVQDAINEAFARGVPVGGTSAGLAVEGEFIYGALGDKPDDNDLASTDVLPDPYFPRVTLARDFLHFPLLQHTITDSHFAKRDRMGRSLGFLARIVEDGWSKSPREIAIDEKSAVLVAMDGKATIVGSGKGAYFMQATQAPLVCQKEMPLTINGISVYKAPAGASFDLALWNGTCGVSYTLSVEKGTIHSTQTNNTIY